VSVRAFIDSILSAADGFHESVLQDLRSWIAKAPQLPKTGSAIAEAGIDTTVLPDEQSLVDSESNSEPDTTATDASVGDTEISPTDCD
jgi:hypothetical protein